MCYSERGDYERVKSKLQHMCSRLYPFILLDKIKKGLNISFWTYLILGEPCIFMSLFYYILQCFVSTFIVLLYDPLTTLMSGA